MADGLFTRMTTYTNRSMPDEPQGQYQTVGVLLRVLGWISLVYVGLGLLAFLFGIVVLAAFGAAMEAASELWFLEWTGALGVPLAALLLFAIVVGLVLLLILGSAWLYWVGTIYEQWRTRDARAPGQVLALSIVAIALGVLFLVGTGDGLMFQVDNAEARDDFAFSYDNSLSGLVLLGFGVVLLVLQNGAEVRTAFARPPDSEGPQ